MSSLHDRGGETGEVLEFHEHYESTDHSESIDAQLGAAGYAQHVGASIDLRSSWVPIDLAAAVAGIRPEPPTIGERTDGVALFYPRRVHWLQGESESLKSWLAQLTATQVLAAGGRVLWIDFEDDEHGVTARMASLGVIDATLLSDDFVYVRPDEPLMTKAEAFTLATTELSTVCSRKFDLAVIDGVTEAMTVEGLSLLDNADIATWLRRLPKMIATKTGAAVVCIDHVVKNSESRGRYAIGGGHKLAGVTGATYKIEARSPLSRALTEPVTGVSIITVQKDRPGWVRSKTAFDGQIAALEITASPDGRVHARLLPPNELNNQPPLDLLRRVLTHLASHEGSSKNKIEECVGGKSTAVRTALKWMVEKEWVRVEKAGQSHCHYVTQAGQEQLNDD